MAPPAADIDVQSTSVPSTIPVKSIAGQTTTGSQLPGPLKYTGSLDSYAQFDVTGVIGREFPELQLSDILQDDEKIRDLAVLGRYLRSAHLSKPANEASS